MEYKDNLMIAILTAFGEVSALFMSQEIKGTQIIMPSAELEAIAERLKEQIVAIA